MIISAGRATGQQESTRLMVGTSGIDIRWYAPNIVRVRVVPTHTFPVTQSLSVIAHPTPPPQSTKRYKTSLEITSGRLRVSVDTATGKLTFADTSGGAFLSASGIDPQTFLPSTAGGERSYRIRQEFSLSTGEGLYGLGQFENPVVNYRGEDILLAQANRTAINPFLVSTKGFGILWDNYSESRFSDSPHGTYFASEVADQIDYYVVYGPALDSVIAGYRLLTGKAPLYGKWAYGYWQSKERYKTGDELLSVLREYRRRNIAIDNIVQDWSYWGGMGNFSGMTWDSTTYPDPKGMIDSLHRNHAHLMVSIWPAFGPASEIFRAMAANGFLYSPDHWNTGKVYDAYNPLARDLYWSYVKKGLFDVGVDAFWMDATEPEFRCSDDRYITELTMLRAGSNHLGSFARYLNTYSLMTTEAVYDHQREATDAKRVYILTRSAFSGQQRYGATTWSGDTFASWDDLRVQIAAGINFSMSGIPYWTNDIGGFNTEAHFPRGLADPAYRELYVRWFQFGTFCPIFRSHGTNIPREIWQFGGPGDWSYDALVASDQLRYRLLDYIYSVAGSVTLRDYSFVRGLAMDFHGDRNVYSISDQYMFGPSLMVCPVTRPMLYPPQYKGIDITPDHFYSPEGRDHGMDLQIYRGTEFKTLVLARKTDACQISWIGCLPEELDTTYSVRMSGKLMSEEKGRYLFHILTNGGVRLWIDNKLLIDQWSNLEQNDFTVPVDLKARTKYALRLEHRQNIPHSASLRINWEKPGAPPPSGNRRRVYFPRGTRWFDFWDGTTREGGRSMLVDAPIGRIPLFVPAGSIIPMIPAIQYASAASTSPIEVRVYPGKDVHFTLYDDEGDNYNYEKGAYSLIPLHWDQSARTLTIDRQEGTFPGAPPVRIFRIVLVRANHGGGSELSEQPDRIVEYRGDPVTITF